MSGSRDRFEVPSDVGSPVDAPNERDSSKATLDGDQKVENENENLSWSLSMKMSVHSDTSGEDSDQSGTEKEETTNVHPDCETSYDDEESEDENNVHSPDQRESQNDSSEEEEDKEDDEKEYEGHAETSQDKRDSENESSCEENGPGEEEGGGVVSDKESESNDDGEFHDAYDESSAKEYSKQTGDSFQASAFQANIFNQGQYQVSGNILPGTVYQNVDKEGKCLVPPGTIFQNVDSQGHSLATHADDGEQTPLPQVRDIVQEGTVYENYKPPAPPIPPRETRPQRPEKSDTPPPIPVKSYRSSTKQVGDNSYHRSSDFMTATNKNKTNQENRSGPSSPSGDVWCGPMTASDNEAKAPGLYQNPYSEHSMQSSQFANTSLYGDPYSKERTEHPTQQGQRQNTTTSQYPGMGQVQDTNRPLYPSMGHGNLPHPYIPGPYGPYHAQNPTGNTEHSELSTSGNYGAMPQGPAGYQPWGQYPGYMPQYIPPPDPVKNPEAHRQWYNYMYQMQMHYPWAQHQVPPHHPPQEATSIPPQTLQPPSDTERSVSPLPTVKQPDKKPGPPLKSKPKAKHTPDTGAKGDTGKKEKKTKKDKTPEKLDYFLCIRNLKSQAERSTLGNFLENCCQDLGLEVDESSIVFVEENSVAVIPMTLMRCKEKELTVDDLSKSVSSAKKTPQSLRGMEISEVERSRHIIVSCEGELPNKNNIKSYFENHGKSGGGKVAKVSEDETGCYILKFKEQGVVPNVCKKPHRVGGKKLNVTPLYITESYGHVFDESLHKVKLPDALIVSAEDEHLHDFVIKSANTVEKLNSKLQPNHAEIRLTDELRIECLLSQTTPNVRQIVKSWEGKVRQIWEDFLKEDLHRMELKASNEAWNPLTKVVDNKVKVHDSNTFQIIQLHDEYKLIFVGERSIVDEVHQEIIKEKDKIVAEIKRKNAITSTERECSFPKISLLQRMGTFTSLEELADDFSVTPEKEKGKIIYTGVPSDITQGRLAVEEALNQLESWTMPEDTLSTNKMKLLETETMQGILKEKFEKNGLTVEFEIQNNKITFYIASSGQKHDVERMVENLLVESTLTLDDTSKNVLLLSEWERELADCQESNYEKVLITPKGDNKITVTATSDLHKSISNRLKKFLEDNSIYSDIVDITEESHMKFVQKYWEDDLDTVERNLSSHSVSLSLQEMKIVINGTKNGIQEARHLLEDMLGNIIWRKHTETKPGIEEIIRADTVGSIEDDTHTLITFSPPKTETARRKSPSPVKRSFSPVGQLDFDRPQLTTSRSQFHQALGTTAPVKMATIKVPVKGPYKCKNGIIIKLIRGELAKQKGDVIVCSTSSDLNLPSGAAGNNLVKVGGNQIMEDIKLNYPNPIDMGEVAVVDGGNLACQKLYLGSLPQWHSDKGKSKKTMYVFMKKCLQQADQSGYSTVIFSALGTGQLKYPKDQAANLMYQCIIDFDKSNPSSVKEVQIICFHGDRDTCSVFETEEHKRLNPDSKTKVYGKGPYETKNKVKITIVKEEIGKHKADILVCAVTKRLDIKGSGASSKSLYDNGGGILQEECSSKYPNGLSNYGEIAIISGGNLHCKELLLTALPSEETKTQKTLCKFVYQCMEYANQKGYKSIGFPAVGTGKISYDRTMVAKNFYSQVKKFSEDNPKSSVKDVRFVLYQKDEETIRVFEAEQAKQLDKGHKQHSSSSPYVTPRCQISVVVETSSITKKKVDAIVCCGTDDLDLSRGRAMQALLREGGESLQQECQNKYPSGIQPRDVAVISGGNLKCSYIYLGTLPRYGSGPQEAENILKDFAKKCLERASNDGLKSVAFPCLGSGFNAYPHDKSAALLYEAIVDFDSQHSSTSIKTVFFVALADDRKSLTAFQIEEANMHSSIASPATSQPADTADQSMKTSFFQKTRTFLFGERKMTQEKETPKSSVQSTKGKQENEVIIGNVTLSVIGGDLTAQKVDAIVNSTNTDLDFSQGGVSAAIKKKCDANQLETERKAKIDEMRKNKLAMTSGCGIPNIKHIIHIECQDKLTAWEAVIIQTLEKAEELSCDSVAFPVLGTGEGFVKFQEDTIGQTFHRAVQKFVAKGSQSSVTKVKIVAFQVTMVTPISKAIREECGKPVDAGLLGALSSIAENVGLKPRTGVVSCKKSQVSSVTVWIYSDNDRNITSALDELDKLVMSRFTSTSIPDTLIQQLKQNEIDQIEEIAMKYPIEMTIDMPTSKIMVEGPQKEVSSAKDEIFKLFRTFQHERFLDEEAKYIASTVQWSVMVFDQGIYTLEKYPERINMKLENAYKDGSTQEVTLNASDGDLIVNLQTMKEYPVNNKNDVSDVVRKELLGGPKIELPACWTDMTPTETVKVVTLQSSSPEYQHLEKKFVDSVKNGVYNTKYGRYPGNKRTPSPADHPLGQFNNVKVHKIERIQNPSLYQQYAAKKISMETSGNLPSNVVLEKELWHGTPQDIIVSINYYGFNRSYCSQNTGTAAWYGNGVYFASDASYSARDWVSKKGPGGKKYMYLVKVLTGDPVVGTQGMRVLPQKPGMHGVIYDSAVDYLQSPMEYVIFNDTQAYPEFCIEFTI